MTHTLINGSDIWDFQAAGTQVYVTQTRQNYITPGGCCIPQQVMTHCSYTIPEARSLWVLLIRAGACHV